MPKATVKQVLKGAVFGVLIGLAATAVAQVVTQGGSQNVVDWYVQTGAHRSCTLTQVVLGNNASASVPTTALAGRKSIEIYNNGGATIYCNPGATAVNTNRPVVAGSAWAIDVTDAVGLRCIAPSGAQASGAATIATECK